MKKLFLCLLLAFAFALSGCATPWQVKTTTGYLAGSVGLSAVNKAYVPPCEDQTLPLDRCTQLKKIYNDTRASYIAAGNTLILAMTTVDATQKDILLEQYPILWERFSALTAEIIALIQQINADQTGTRVPEPKVEITVTPQLIQWIISGLVAVIEMAPKIYEIIMAAQASPADIEMLVGKIQEAQASLPVWP